MIYAKTNLTAIPENCKECPFSKISSVRDCPFTDSECEKPKKRGRGWVYSRNEDCPLVEVEGGD